MNSISGETWVLGPDDPLKWEPVQDNLMPIYKKDPTKQWGLGVSLPDGRDINELSKEELIRVIQAMARNQKIVNPNDPLGMGTRVHQTKNEKGCLTSSYLTRRNIGAEFEKVLRSHLSSVAQVSAH